MAETEARSILESCADLVQGIDYDKEDALVKRLQSQVDASVADINKVIDDAKAKRPEIVKIVTEANQTIEKIRQYQGQAEETVKQLRNTLDGLATMVQGDKAKLDNDLKRAQSVLDNALARLHELDEAISQGKQRVEACLFVKDMRTAQATLLTSYKATLLGKDDLGNMAVKQTWGGDHHS